MSKKSCSVLSNNSFNLGRCNFLCSICLRSLLKSRQYYYKFFTLHDVTTSSVSNIMGVLASDLNRPDHARVHSIVHPLSRHIGRPSLRPTLPYPTRVATILQVTLNQMVTRNTLRTRERKKVFFLNNFKFMTIVDINKCLKQVELPISSTRVTTTI